jgi:hypothetical protein
MTRLRTALVVVACIAALGGCGVHGLAFRADDRVEIVRPDDHATTTLPVAVVWRVRSGRPVGHGSSYGIVVDRPPPPPGRTLGWLLRNDDTCGASGCPDPAYRAQRGVFQTTATRVEVAEIPSNSSHRKDAAHEATVFLLDAAGRRVGESAWTVAFDVPKRGTS